jgi:hypothetical protein
MRQTRLEPLITNKDNALLDVTSLCASQMMLESMLFEALAGGLTNESTSAVDWIGTYDEPRETRTR